MSPEADRVTAQVLELHRYKRGSQYLDGPKQEVLSEIARMEEECAAPGWDGDSARPTNLEAAENAKALIRALPETLPLPEIAPEPDGSVSLEWIFSRGRRFSISVAAGDRLAYAWLNGKDRGHGIARFDRERIPPKILDLIQDTMGVMYGNFATLRSA